MKKSFLLCLITALLCACSSSEEPVLTIFHTNDIQGFYWARNYAANDNKESGGFAVLKNMLEVQEDPYLLFDSGDTFSRTQEGQITKLEGAIKIMNKLKYSAATLSAADLSLGWDIVEPALSQAQFPIVVSNIENRDGTQPKYIKKYTVIQKEKLKIAVLGLVSKADFPDIQRNSGVKITDEIETLKKIIPAVQEKGADIIIVLSSLGFELEAAPGRTDEKAIAEEIPEISLILGGNGDLSTDGFEEISKTYISRAKTMLFEIDKIDLFLNKNKQPSYKYQELILDKEKYGEDEEVLEIVNQMRKSAKNITGRKIAELKTDLAAFSDKPSPLGIYTADCIRKWANNDIGIINSDAFLSGFTKGPLTEVELYNAMPFNDRVMFLKMRGDELKNALEYSIETKTNWPQIAGINVTYDSDAPLGKKIKKVTLNGAPLRDDAVYSISSSDHIVAGGFGHNEFLNVFEFKNTDRTVRDIVRWCMYRQKEISAPATDTWKTAK